MSFEYLVQKVSQNDVSRASEVLSERGAEGWKVVYVTPFSQDLVVVFEREERPSANPPAPKKRTAPKKKKAK